MNQELRSIFVADQEDRTTPVPIDELVARDAPRLERVRQLLDAGAVVDPEDHYHAAMVLQHGPTVDDSWTAHELATKAAEAGYRPARWLAAAAYDRWLMRQGQPQRFGTQYVAMLGGPRMLWEVDPTTTDKEREAWNVPPLAEALAQAEGRVQAAATFVLRRPAG